jgi:hypothetical protein
MVIFREQGGPNTGNSGHVDSDDAEARPTAWLRHCAVNQANLGRCADRGRRFTLPVLQRLLLQGWVKAEWKTTETNRRARFYTLTTAGRKHLGLDVSQFRQMMAAISRVLEDAEEAG